MKTFEIEKRIREKSEAKGIAEGMAKAILALLATKGTIPPQLESAVYAQADANILEQWLLLAAAAENIDAFEVQAEIYTHDQKHVPISMYNE